IVVGKRAKPTVISPQNTVLEGEKEEIVVQTKLNEDSNNNLKIDDVRNLEKSKEYVDQILQVDESLIDSCFSLNIEVNEDVEEEFSDDELSSIQSLEQVETFESLIKLSSLNSSEFSVVNINSLNKFGDEVLKNLKPSKSTKHVLHHFSERKNYCPDTGLSQPNRVIKTPVEISIFGQKSYRRNEAIKNFVNDRVDRSLKKGYHRPDYAKALIDDENPWKHVVRVKDL
ncbi:hypothetical protein PV325_013338, partial [Microctonus aethiopoides]